MVRRVDPGLERLPVHESPFQCRLDEAENLANPIMVFTSCFASPWKSSVPWLIVSKLGTHLVSTTLGSPRLDGIIVRMREDDIILILSSLYSL